MAMSIRPLALLAVLVINVGWDRQTCASAQFVKGGGVKGSVKGNSGKGSSLPFGKELGVGSAASGGTKGLSAVKGFFGGTKGGAPMTKGGLASPGTKGTLGTLSIESSIDGKSFMAKQTLASGIKGVQASASSQQAPGFVKGGLSLNAQQSQQSIGLKGAKTSSRLSEAMESKWSKGSVKGATLGGFKQSQEKFGLKGAKGGQEIWNEGFTKGSSSTSMKKTQRSTRQTDAVGSNSLKGVSGNQWGTKEFVKGGNVDISGQSQHLSSFQNGGTSLIRTKDSRFGKVQSFDSLQNKQQSSGAKGFKSGSASRFLEQEANQGPMRMVSSGALGLGADTQKPWNQKSLVKGGAGEAFKRRASRFSGMPGGTQQTQQSGLKRMAHQTHQAHQAHQTHFSYKSTGIMRAVSFQPQPGQKIGFAQESFSGQRWSSKDGLAASGKSFSGQFQQSGGNSLLQQQRHALSVGQQKTGALRGASGHNPSQQLQLGTVQRQQKTVLLQRGSDGQRISVGSALTNQQNSVGQISQSGQIKNIQQASQQSPASFVKSEKPLTGQLKSPSISILADVKSLQQPSSVKTSQTSANGALSGQFSGIRASEQLSKQPVAVPGLDPAAVFQQTASQQLQRTGEAGMKTALSLGSLISASQQKAAKGFLQQQQQQLQ